MSKKAVLFDLDGTLINSIPDISRSVNFALAAHGLPTHDEKTCMYMVGNGARVLIERAVGDKQDMVDAVLQTYREHYAVHCFDSSHVYPGIEELLQALRNAGYKLIVLSNKDDGDVQTVMRRYFPDMHFDLLRGKLPGRPVKPDPSSALTIARELSLSPDEFWYIGDTPVDCQCCKNAGMHFIGVSYGFRTREEIAEAGAQIIVDTPKEALDIIIAG